MRSTVLLPVVLLLALIGLAFADVRFAPEADAATRTEMIDGARRVAVKQVTDPYSYGSAGPDRFDCSGLVYYSYRAAGLNVPRTANDQARLARRINKSYLKPGDFMYFYNDSGRVFHVGIFVGRKDDGRPVMLHAPRSGGNVGYATPWTSRWYAGTLR